MQAISPNPAATLDQSGRLRPLDVLTVQLVSGLGVLFLAAFVLAVMVIVSNDPPAPLLQGMPQP